MGASAPNFSCGLTHLTLTQFRNYRHLTIDLNFGASWAPARWCCWGPTAPARPTSWRRSRSWVGAAACIAPSCRKSISAAPATRPTWPGRCTRSCARGARNSPSAPAAIRWARRRSAATAGWRGSTAPRPGAERISPRSCRCNGWCRRWTGCSTMRPPAAGGSWTGWSAASTPAMPAGSAPTRPRCASGRACCVAEFHYEGGVEGFVRYLDRSKHAS